MIDRSKDDGAAGSREPRLMAAELGRIVLATETLDSVLHRVATIARDAINGADAVSVTLLSDDEPYTAASTGALALEADRQQYETGHGPCSDAARGGVLVVVDDLATERRWPEYAAQALPGGVRSSVSVPLPVQDEVIGALNIYGTRPRAFDQTDVETAQEVATYGAVAVANAKSHTEAAELADHMQRAMVSRAVIDQAKGIIMAQRGCNAEDAFRILSEASQRSNRKVRDIATAMVEGISRPA